MHFAYTPLRLENLPEEILSLTISWMYPSDPYQNQRLLQNIDPRKADLASFASVSKQLRRLSLPFLFGGFSEWYINTASQDRSFSGLQGHPSEAANSTLTALLAHPVLPGIVKCFTFFFLSSFQLTKSFKACSPSP